MRRGRETRDLYADHQSEQGKNWTGADAKQCKDEKYKTRDPDPGQQNAKSCERHVWMDREQS